MSRSKKLEPEKESLPIEPATPSVPSQLMIQAWAAIALWMILGLVLEGLLGYKSPAYLQDSTRRELFRLAHTHGVLLNLLLIAAALCSRWRTPPPMAQHALRLGSVLMPIGFLLSGLWHPEGDPGIAIWLVPPGALLVIFSAIATALSWKRNF